MFPAPPPHRRSSFRAAGFLPGVRLVRPVRPRARWSSARCARATSPCSGCATSRRVRRRAGSRPRWRRPGRGCAEVQRDRPGDFGLGSNGAVWNVTPGGSLPGGRSGSLSKLAPPCSRRPIVAQCAVGAEVPARPCGARERPLVLVAIDVPALDQEPDRRLVHEAGVDALQPVVVPAQDQVMVVGPGPQRPERDSVSMTSSFFGASMPS